MSNVKITSEVFFMGWQLCQQDIGLLEIEDMPFAKGGYGSVYEVKSNLIHQFDSNISWVLKISEASNSICKAGYRNITELSRKVVAWQSTVYPDYKQLLLNYQALIGYPQAHFTGELEGEPIFGYIMPDLRSMGYTLFSEVEDNEEAYEQYLEESNEGRIENARLKAVYNLAKVFDLLYDQFEYLHGDIKAQSVWLNLVNYRSAIIDFDGGIFRPKLLDILKKPFEAKIMGAQQPWLAPEILRHVNEATGNAKLEVSWQSDYWAFACGAFQIITGLAPFSFLKETSFKAWEQYLKSNEWPLLRVNQVQFQVQGEDAFAVENDFQSLKERSSLWSLFKKTFNQGFKNRSNRKSFREWLDVLFNEITNKQPSVNIQFAPKRFLEGMQATVSWQCADGLLCLDGNYYHSTGSLTDTFKDVPLIEIHNEFGEWPVKAPVEIIKKPVISNIRLSAGSIPAGQTVTLTWEQQFAARVVLFMNNRTVELPGNSVILTPETTQNIELKFFSLYDLEVVAKLLPIEVVHPVDIESFIADREFIAETLPITLTWKTIHADVLKITGVERALDANGEVVVRPKTSGEIILSASNKFFTKEKSIYIEVLPVPRIENLKLPSLPGIQVFVPDLSNSILPIMEEIATPNDLFHKIFDEYE